VAAPRLFRVILPVADIERAADFYRKVFLDDGERVSPGRHYFDCGGTILACYDPVADGDGDRGQWRLEFFYFAVTDLDAALERVRSAGGRVTQEIKRMPWGERMFYARDPFDNRISFVDATTVFTGTV